jgi:outer membrane lipopolysaccharide assembly protein LptE/RlpB
MMRKTLPYILLGLLTVFSENMGCGYKLAGGGALPAGVKIVCVSIFENRSTAIGLENQLANDLIYEMTRNGLKVVSDPGSAQAVLTGVIRSVASDTASYTGSQVAFERRVTMIADVSFKDSEGQVIWAGDGLRERETYTTNRENSQDDEANRKGALTKLSKRFAESVYNRLADDF